MGEGGAPSISRDREPDVRSLVDPWESRDTSMHRPSLYIRFCAAAFALLIGSSAISPAIEAVHMVVVCSDEGDEGDEVVEALPTVPPCHPQEEAPADESAELLCCPSDAVFEPVPVPRVLQDVHQSLVAVEHPELIIDTRPIQVFGLELQEQVPRGIPSVGLPVFNASLLI